MAIGSDRATIHYQPARDAALLSAVLELLPAFSREAIVTGAYHPKAVTAFGASLWHRIESVVESYRPSPLLDLVAACASAEAEGDQQKHETKDEPVIDTKDATAARFLALLFGASAYRAQHGKEFWGGFARHRIERHRRERSLAAFAARVMDACSVAPTADSTRAAMGMLAEMDEAETAAVSEAIRERPALVLALAYEEIQRTKESAR